MENEILKRNIEQAINQPCIAHYPTRVEQNGLSEDGMYIMVQVEPKDSSRQIDLIDGYVDKILASLPEKYRDRLVTLRHDNWVSYSYVPVFDTDTQGLCGIRSIMITVPKNRRGAISMDVIKFLAL